MNISDLKTIGTGIGLATGAHALARKIYKLPEDRHIDVAMIAAATALAIIETVIETAIASEASSHPDFNVAAARGYFNTALATMTVITVLEAHKLPIRPDKLLVILIRGIFNPVSPHAPIQNVLLATEEQHRAASNSTHLELGIAQLFIAGGTSLLVSKVAASYFPPSLSPSVELISLAACATTVAGIRIRSLTKALDTERPFVQFTRRDLQRFAVILMFHIRAAVAAPTAPLLRRDGASLTRRTVPQSAARVV